MTQKEDWLYYFALYHALAHWTAYIAILVLLVTIGFLLSTGQISTITHTKSAVCALLGLWAAEVYLILRIMKLGKFIQGQLGQAVRQLELLRHPGNHLITIGAATVIASWDILLVLGKV